MSEWTRVERCFEATLVLDREADLHEQRVTRSRRALAEWFVRADDWVLVGLWNALDQRARELARLGAKVDVRPPHSPGRARGSSESRRFVTVSYGREEVMVYSTRTAVSLTVDWAWTLKRPGARFPRILSVPGFRVRRGPNAELLLERRDSDHDLPVSLDDAACTILGMLADAARTRARRRSFAG